MKSFSVPKPPFGSHCEGLAAADLRVFLPGDRGQRLQGRSLAVSGALAATEHRRRDDQFLVGGRASAGWLAQVAVTAGLTGGVARWRNQSNRSCVMAIHKATANAFNKPRTRNCSKPCRLRAWALTHSLVAARSL